MTLGKGPRLGVVGTLVWDTIRRVGRAPIEEWGGIAYALGGVCASLPEAWEVVPLLKVGRDLEGRAVRFLRGLPRVHFEAIQPVPEPNNRVELIYADHTRRTERLSGGVGPWTAPELLPRLSDLDALYVNFISGFEMTVETAEWLRQAFDGPIYADLHSLFLAVSAGGLRTPQALPELARWLRCFDAIQMNEAEFALLAEHSGDPWALAAQLVGGPLRVLLVTLGERGAAFVAAPDFHPDPLRWPKARRALGPTGTALSRRITSTEIVPEPDPTGCGDVWGATCFARLLAGDALDVAMSRANTLAGRNAALNGATGLHLHLTGRLSSEVHG